jgi:hypothetical protein
VKVASRRDDRTRARECVNGRVKWGAMPRARTLPCVDCGGQARDYDHAHGYARENWLNVEAVCSACHAARRVARGELAKGERNGAYTQPEQRPRGSAHGNAKLTEADVVEIRARRTRGEPYRVIAAAFGITPTNACFICKRKAWAHVP